MPDAVVELRDLHHTFNRGRPSELTALAGVTLELEPGAFVVVLGANGSGKTTLLNAIAGTFIPERGSIELEGRNVTRWPASRRASRIGRVFQNPFSGTAPNMTIAENLAIAMRRGVARRSLRVSLGEEGRRELIERIATLGMGLEARLDDRIGLLSGGQRQAITLLMATLVRPAVLLLDEHTAALDPKSGEQVLRLTQQIIERDALTTLMVTHSLQQAVRLGTRVIMMHRGKIVRDFSGARKSRLRIDDLLDAFDQLRYADQLDQSAAEMLQRNYV